MFCIAAVAMVVFGQRAFTPILCGFNSSASPNTHMLMPNLLMLYARKRPNHSGFRVNGGDKFRICALVLFFKAGIHALLIKKVPRTFISCIRSQRLGSR